MTRNTSLILNHTDEVKQYMKDIRQYPLLTLEREEQIFKELRTTNISKERKQKLQNELVTGCLRFVISVAKSYQSQGLEILDLISEGNFGLIKAAEKFDPTTGLKFISYAVWWVRQSIIAALNDHSRTIRLPTNVIQDSQKKKRQEERGDDTKINPSEESGSVHLPYCVGLFDPINEDGDQIIDLIPNNGLKSPDDLFNSPEEIKKRVKMLLSVLDERERVIIEKYYGLSGYEANLDDLGEEFGCTKERVRQLRDKSIKKLRNESFVLLNYQD